MSSEKSQEYPHDKKESSSDECEYHPQDAQENMLRRIFSRDGIYDRE